MKTSIEKSESGAVRFLYGDAEKPYVISNPVNVSIKSVVVPRGMPIEKIPAIQFSFQDGRGSQTVIFSDLVNINGAAKPADIDEAVILLSDTVFNFGGGSGIGAVESVIGNLVSGTASNPIISLMGTPSDIVTFDDAGNPEVKPMGIRQLTDVAGFPTFSNGVFVATAMDPVAKTGLLLFIEFSTTTPKAGTFPTYNTGGTLPVANAASNGDAVNLGQLNIRVPAPPGSGNYSLKSQDGVVTWVVDTP